EDGARLQAGEIGAGARLAVALAPADPAARDRRQVLEALLLRAELEQHRREHPQAEALERQARADAAHLLVEDRGVFGRQIGAAVFSRPRRRDPAALGHALEPHARVVGEERRAPPAPHPLALAGDRRAHRRRAICRKPRARVVAKAAHAISRRAAAARARSSARSSIMSSCPPTVLRRPSSTRRSRGDTPYFSPARCANKRNDEYTPA